ncbi:MAG: hypothetical protein ACHQ51_03940 [Elusimicrobiota bacterium]
MNGHIPSEGERGAMRPTGWALSSRNFFPFQLYRFLWINWRMITMIRLSHPKRIAPAPVKSP